MGTAAARIEAKEGTSSGSVCEWFEVVTRLLLEVRKIKVEKD